MEAADDIVLWLKESLERDAGNAHFVGIIPVALSDRIRLAIEKERSQCANMVLMWPVSSPEMADVLEDIHDAIMEKHDDAT